MKITASNSEKGYFVGSVQFDEKDKEQKFSDTLLTFCEGLSMIVSKFLLNFAENNIDAKEFNDVIIDTLKLNINELIKSGTFEKLLNDRHESELYKFMEDVFDSNLKKLNKTELDYLDIFKDYDTLKLEISNENEIFNILITNSDRTKREIVDSFDLTATNDKELERITGKSYIIATILGDKLYGENNNPIRSLENTPGFAEGGLIKKICDNN